VEIVEYEPCAEIVWTSITGVDQRGRLRLRDSGEGQVKLTMRVSYGAPGVLLGTLAELLSVPQVSGSVKRSLGNLKHEVEGTERPAPGGPGLPQRLAHEAGNLWILARSGMVAPMRPDRVARIALIGARWGASPAAGVLVGAVRHPDRPMIIDELGTLSYREVDERSGAVAHSLREAGVVEGDRIGVMCRDHRGFVEVVMGVAKVGADVLLLNTSFAARQLTEVCQREDAVALIYDEEFTELVREDAVALIYDEEFTELVREAGADRLRFVAWHEGRETEDPKLSDLVGEGDVGAVSPPARTGRVTILTSGTTGTPKGASRSTTPATLDPPAALLDRIPLREVLVVVPVMLQRILALAEEERRRHDTGSLHAVCASGSALAGGLATQWMDELGENLYNMYGSTEVSPATLATPHDMRAAPGTAGKPTRIDGQALGRARPRGPQGETGRIFVGMAMLFEGYTGGGSKDQVGGLMATGDVGRFDEAGRLFVEGRDDEMIVSGGENVFPKEVEDALAEHVAVAEAAAIGVEDEKFGQRLRAFVVVRSGRDVGEQELKDHVKENLARYKVPREIVFLDELPRNPTGKVLKRELADGGEDQEAEQDEAAGKDQAASNGGGRR